MTPNAITCLFKEDHDSSPPLEGKLADNDLLAIRETTPPLLMVIPYNQLNGVHSLMAILTKAAKYMADHGNTKFVCLARLLLYDKRIANDAIMVVRVCVEAAHKSRLDNYASFETAEHCIAKFLCDVVNEVQYNLYKGHALNIISHHPP